MQCTKLSLSLSLSLYIYIYTLPQCTTTSTSTTTVLYRGSDLNVRVPFLKKSFFVFLKAFPANGCASSSTTRKALAQVHEVDTAPEYWYPSASCYVYIYVYICTLSSSFSLSLSLSRMYVCIYVCMYVYTYESVRARYVCIYVWECESKHQRVHKRNYTVKGLASTYGKGLGFRV